MAFSTSKPLSVKEIVRLAEDFEFNTHIPSRYWLRTADNLLKESEIYEAENNHQQTYLLLMRWIALVTEYLPAHPDARSSEATKSLKAAQKSVRPVVERLEVLKPQIEARYNVWKSLRSPSAPSVTTQDTRRYSIHDEGNDDHSEIGEARPMDADEHRYLALQLAHQTIWRRDAGQRVSRRAGISDQEEQERRTAGIWEDWTTSLSNEESTKFDNDLRHDMEAARWQIDSLERPNVRPAEGSGHHKSARLSMGTERHKLQSQLNYHYPTISSSDRLVSRDTEAYRRSTDHHHHEVPPPRPSKDVLYASDGPARPAKQPLSSETKSSAADAPQQPASAFSIPASAFLENGSPLRTLYLPSALRDRFLSIALPNTRANLETCAMLCGTLASNALLVTHLVIPEQESTSDTCETTNEGALFDYCDSVDLMVLGWIHTHPTQTCFMSSRDLHTHCSYQVMMPESIAVVCAPSKTPSWGVFRLTDPPGMKSVLNCRQTGLFHPHAERDIYTDALRPGHVVEATGLDFKVVDLRPAS